MTKILKINRIVFFLNTLLVILKNSNNDKTPNIIKPNTIIDLKLNIKKIKDNNINDV